MSASPPESHTESRTLFVEMTIGSHIAGTLPAAQHSARDPAVGQGVTVKAEARIDLVERRRVRGS
jgi:hypothetical protein